MWAATGTKDGRIKGLHACPMLAVHTFAQGCRRRRCALLANLVLVARAGLRHAACWAAGAAVPGGALRTCVHDEAADNEGAVKAQALHRHAHLPQRLQAVGVRLALRGSAPSAAPRWLTEARQALCTRVWDPLCALEHAMTASRWHADDSPSSRPHLPLLDVVVDQGVVHVICSSGTRG